jgi:hypothetical protein
MYCPLCKAEYRAGFTKCSDCYIGLVATKEEAEQAQVKELWSGGDEDILNALLSSLANAGIPYRFREILKSNPLPWISLLFWHLRKPEPVSELRVEVFGRDTPRAKEILDRVTAVEPFD